jgi:hypothetical protein
VEVRAHAVKRLRYRTVLNGRLESAARVIMHVVQDHRYPHLRRLAALALAEFTDVEGVVSVLGSVARDPAASVDVRYSAFTSLERAGPTLKCVALVRRVRADETLGAAARSLLSVWHIEPNAD